MTASIALAAACLLCAPASAQHNISAGGTNYTEDFDALTGGPWTDNSTLPGWYARTSGGTGTSISAYAANTGGTTTAGFYAFGVAGTNPLSDRALGYAPSNGFTGNPGTGYMGWRLKNNTGSAITSIAVTWTGEQWRKDNASSQSLALSYQQGATVTSLTTGTWTSTGSTFTSPNPGTGGLLDGNASGNRTAGITVNIVVDIPPGEEIMLRWEDPNDSGNDHFLAIDNVIVNATTDGGGPSCGISLGTPTTSCNASTPGVDTYDLHIPYTGMDAGTFVVNNSASGTVGGDDPATTSNGTIIISGINEGDAYDVAFTSPCESLTVTGASPACVPPPVTYTLAAWDFTGENAGPATSAAEVYHADLDASNLLTRGGGAAASTANNSFRTTGFSNNGIATSNTDYFQFTLSADPGYTLSLATIHARVSGTATYSATPGASNQFAYSLNGSSFTLIGSPSVTVGSNQTFSVDVSGISALQNVADGTTVTFRFYATGQTSGGGWGFFSDASGNYGLALEGSVDGGGPSCGISLGTPTTSCNASTPGVDTYDLLIPYTGMDAGTSVVNNSASGTVGGDDPATTSNGTIIISGINEGDAYDVAFTSPCESLTVTGASPACVPPPVTYTLAAWDFTGEAEVATSDAEVYHADLDASNTLTRGAGAAASAGNNSFRTQGFSNNGISTANTDYFQFTLSAASGYALSLSAIHARVSGTATYSASPNGASNQFAYSLDGTTFTLIGSPSVTIGTNQTFSVDVSGVGALQNVADGTIVTFRYYASGQTTGGGWGFFSNASGNYGLAVEGSLDDVSGCGIALGTPTTTCNANTPGVDTYDLHIPYTGMDAATSVVNNTVSGTIGGDDPATVPNGTIIISGIDEGDAYDVTFTSLCASLSVSGASPACEPSCGITLGTVTATCNTITAGPGDTYDLTIEYTGSEAGVTLTNNSGSGTITGDDPAVTANGTIVISGIDEGDAYDISFSAPCGALSVAGAAPGCEPPPSLTVISFDVAGNWTQGSGAFTSYQADHVYAESGWSFTGGPANRETMATQDGYPGFLGTFAWRMNQNVELDWRATYNGSEAITQFGFKVRRWDGSPDVNAEVRYSTDGGATFSPALITINNSYLEGSSDWKTFAYAIPAPVQLTPGSLVVQVVRTVASGERMMIDDFTFDTGEITCALVLGSATAVCDAFTDDVDTYTVTIPYTGMQEGTSVVNNSGSGTIGGDDPGTVENGVIIISGITEGTGYSIAFEEPCETFVISGASPICLPAPSIVINEVDYDQPGADIAEFIELKNTGASPVELGGLKLVLVNGGGDSPYNTITLPTFTLPAGGYYVVGSALVPNVDLVAFTTDGIQNGAPDGIRLTSAANDIIDQMSYEGAMITTEGNSAPTDPGNAATAGLGLSRMPDGADTDDNSMDFVLTCLTPGEANGGMDSDEDGTPDCVDLCPGGPEPGSPCDDGNEMTGDDTVQEDCNCVGIELDCEGVPGGPSMPGEPCIDGDPGTLNDTWQPDCSCRGEVPDCLGELGGPNLPGAPCNDYDPSTNDEVWDVFCGCAGTPCSQNVVLDLRSDANSDQIGWEILYQNDGTVVCSGGSYPAGITDPIVEPCCLPIGCFRLRVYDSGGDGFVSGGYQLRESGTNGRRIIDNFGNFSTGSVSALGNTYGNGAFCVPIGDDKLIFSSCDKLDWVNNKFIVVAENPAVSAQYGIANTTSGYEFWFYDPNGGYNFRRFRSHATSDGYGTGALRANHFKINGWTNSGATPHIPANVLLNVRIRGRVAGVNQPFGAACLFKIDTGLAACPRVKLQDDPANVSDYSCGVSRNFGGSSNAANRIYANPPQPVPTVASSNVRYQFRFRIPGEGICIVRPPQTSAQLVLNWTNGPALQCSRTYEVDVRVSLNGGATWCFGPASSSAAAACADTEDWGKVCNVTINACAQPNGGGSNMTSSAGSQDEQRVALYPNPNNGDQLFIELNGVEEGMVQVDIFDMTGKRVVARSIAVQDGMLKTNLDLNGGLSNGLYMVHVTAGTKSHTERLVIAR